MTRLFISHATKDDDTINALERHLREAGIETWIDHREGINVGANWDATIRAALKACDACVLVMSAHALESDICQAECLLARELKKTIYVLKLGVVAPESVWLFIKMAQYADISGDMAAGVAKLVRVLKGERGDDLPDAVYAPITGGAQMRLTLPYVDNPLRGREADVATLTGMLGGAVVQLVGTGGLGKSRLAAELARAQGAGAIWHKCGRADDMVSLIVAHYGLADTATRAAALARLSAAADKPLFILDNGEDIDPKTPERAAYLTLMAELLHAGAPVLLTSRVVWDELKPRREHTPAALNTAVGTQITQDFATSESITLTEEDARRLADAARLHPRLIEKAVDLLHERGLEKVITLLTDLTHYEIEDALDEMITRTVEQMKAARGGEAAAEWLRRLTLFAGSYDEAAALALGAPDGATVEALDDALALLQKYRFVRREGERYRTDGITKLAMGKKIASTEYDTLFERYADVYIERATQFEVLPLERWGQIASDIEDITAVGDALVIRTKMGTTGDLQRARDFSYNITQYLGNRHEVRREEWLEMGLNAARRLEVVADTRPDQSLFLHELGVMWSHLGDKQKALTYYKQALSLWQLVGDRSGEAATLSAIGFVWSALGDKQKALTYYEQSLPLRRLMGDSGGEAVTLNNTGTVWLDLGEPQKALAYFEQALSLMQEIEDRNGEGTTLNNIGGVWSRLDDNRKALTYYERALPLLQAVGNRSAEALALSNIGGVWSDIGDKQKGLAYLEQALSVYCAVEDRSGEATMLNKIGYIYFQNGEPERAAEILEQIIVVMQGLGAVAEEAAFRFNLAVTLERLGRITDTLAQVSRAIELLHTHNLPQDAAGHTMEQMEAFLAQAQVRQQKDK